MFLCLTLSSHLPSWNGMLFVPLSTLPSISKSLIHFFKTHLGDGLDEGYSCMTYYHIRFFNVKLCL